MAHFFCIFHALSFELTFLFYRSFPLTHVTFLFSEWRIVPLITSDSFQCMIWLIKMLYKFHGFLS